MTSIDRRMLLTRGAIGGAALTRSGYKNVQLSVLPSLASSHAALNEEGKTHHLERHTTSEVRSRMDDLTEKLG